MIETINAVSAVWASRFSYMAVHNALFVGIILLLLHFFRNRSAVFLRGLALIGLVKLIVPPFITIPLRSEAVVGIPTGIITWGKAGAVQAAGLSSEPTLVLSSYLFLIWTAVLIFFISFALFRMAELKHKYRVGKTLSAQELSGENIPENVIVFQSNHEHSPLVFGFFRHTVVVPRSWKSWPDECRRAILAHEFAHIRQRDSLVNLLQVTALAVNFFNPLAWILSRKLNHYTELVCDDRAVNVEGVQPVRYSRFLVQVAEMVSGPRHAFATAPSFSDSHRTLEERIHYQLDRLGEQRMKITKNQFFVLAFTGLMLIIFSWSCNTENSPVPQENPVTPDLEAVTNVSRSAVPESELPPFLPFEDQPKIVGGLAALQKLVKYPESAKLAGIEGLVIIQVLVDREGNPQEFTVVQSLGQNGFDEAVIEAIRQVKFIPAKQNGSPVPFRMNIPVRFRSR